MAAIDTDVRLAVKVILKIADAIVEAVAEGGKEGAAETTIHLAMTQVFGDRHAQHQKIIDALVGAGRLRREGHRLYQIHP